MLTPYGAVKDFILFDLVGHFIEANVYITPLAVVMNKKKSDNLPEGVKKALDQAGGEKLDIHAARVYDDDDQTTLAEIKKRGKIQVNVVPADEK
jgi:TRAP-type C4-dicarboxylate transport system substrate-binding protein